MKPEGNWKLPQEPTKSRLPPVAYQEKNKKSASINVCIIFRVHVHESNMLDAAPIGVLADRSDVRHPDACAVVGLEHDAVGDVQVVVNGLVVGALEGACPLGVAQVGQVDDVGDGDAVRDHAFDFVELVVQQDELVPVALGPPPLVCIRGSGVLESAEHLRVGFVGRVPDGDRIFVVGDADVAAIVAAVGAVVCDCHQSISECDMRTCHCDSSLRF
jgi:hypothetical protein